MKYYTETIEKTFENLGAHLEGLSKSEVEERVREHGLNAITVKGEPLWRKLVAPFTDVFTAVLAVAIAVSLWHGEYVDAAIIGAIMFINALIYYVQRFSTERILRALQKKNPHIVDVLRSDKAVQVDAEELVPGDIVLLEEGQKIPADCRVFDVNSLRVDESQLTGESMPVEKQIDAISEKAEVYERTNMVYQGSFVVGGQARAVVVATGNHTEFGKLAALSINEHEDSPVQQRIDKLISMLVRIIAGIAAAAFALALYRGMDVSDAVRYVLALSVSAVPESLPIAITVVLVLGMRRMAKKKALVKSSAAIETIGIVTAIASDKTGTLTKNMLTVQYVWSGPKTDSESQRAVACSTLPATSKTRDPLDVAMEMHAAGHARGGYGQIVSSLPFNQLVAMSGNVVESRGERNLWVKGAPERIIEHCKLTKKQREEIQQKVTELAASGLRVLALATAPVDERIEEFDELPAKTKYEFMGLIGVADVLRKEAKAAIEQAHRAGIRVYMVTGDHFETAFHIAKQLGIVEKSSEVFDSRKMRDYTDEQLAKIVESTRVFARVLPKNKHRLLTILKESQITAMTGDGVNDVPALSGAHVGISMGSGTSIAKDAGDIILLDNNFRSIVRAVHEGRTIYANIKRMVSYLLATNAGEVIVALGALVMGVPVPLIAVQILWVNLVTDSFLAIPLGLEPGERRNMLKPPQRPDAPLFSKFMLSRIALIATTMGALTLTLYVIFLDSHGVDYARVVAFNALVVMQWANAFNTRSDYESLWTRLRRQNWPFYGGLAMAIGCQILAMSGALHGPLGLKAYLTVPDLILTSLIAFAGPIIVTEIHKWVGRRFFGKGSRRRYRY